MTQPRSGSKSHYLAALVVILLIVMVPFLVRAILQVETTSSSVHPWFPDGTSARREFLIFDQKFGPEDYWLVSIAGETSSEAIQKVANAIREENELSEPRLLRRIRTGTEVTEGLDAETAAIVKEELKGVLLNQAGTRELIFAESTEYGFKNRGEVYSQVIEKVSQRFKDEHDIKVIGPGYVGVMADRETRKTLKLVTPFTLLLSGLLAFILLRDLRITAIVLIVSGVAAALPIAIVHYSGAALSHLLVVVPSLAQLLALSNSIHLIQYYSEALDTPSEKGEAWWVGLRNGWAPTTAASLTTVIGFLSLQVSSLPVVRDFSLYGSIAVIGSTLLVLTMVPAGLILLNPVPSGKDWIRNHVIPRLDRAVSKRKSLFYLPLLLLFVLAFFGLGRLKTEIRTEEFFPKGSELQQNMTWFEEEFGQLQACQLMGRFTDSTSFPDQWKCVSDLGSTLKKMESECKVVLPVSEELFERVKALQGEEAAMKWLREKVVSEEIYRESEGEHYWRITLYHEPVADISDSPFHRELEQVVEIAEEEAIPAQWTITGTYHLFADAQRILMTELMKTFMLAFVLITPCVILFLRSFSYGLVAIIGNVFPVVVFFGVIGFLGVRVDIATMIIASIAFGIAVDDTIHYLTWLARSKSLLTGDVQSRVSFAYRRAGAAILKTTLIISVGMLAFLLSDFGPSRRFAVFTSVVLVLAAVGDLILLPALIAGPLARFFRNRGSK